MRRGQRDVGVELEELDAVFKALAHASRRHVLFVLHFRGGEMSAGQIASRFACSWPTTTRHLRVLEEAGLVTVTQRGRERVYRLERERLQGIVGDWLGWFEHDGKVASSGKPRRAAKKRGGKKTTSRR